MDETKFTTLPTFEDKTTEILVPRVEADSLGPDDDEIPATDTEAELK
jgi:hypothetical protein